MSTPTAQIEQMTGIESGKRLPRKRTSLPAGIFDGSSISEGVIEDIGAGGARVTVDNPAVAVGQEIVLKFRVDSFADWGEIKATVVWRKNADASAETPRTVLGLDWRNDASFDPRWLWFLRFPYYPN